jgi:hypothetical protein
MKINVNKLHIISWIIKDSFWCLQLPTLAKIGIIPTIIFSLYILYKDVENRLENLTITSWVMMNIFWMLHEFHEQIPKYFSYAFMTSSAILSVIMIIETYKKRSIY